VRQCSDAGYHGSECPWNCDGSDGVSPRLKSSGGGGDNQSSSSTDGVLWTSTSDVRMAAGSASEQQIDPGLDPLPFGFESVTS